MERDSLCHVFEVVLLYIIAGPDDIRRGPERTTGDDDLSDRIMKFGRVRITRSFIN